MTQADIIRALKIINSFPSHTTRPRGVQQGFFLGGGGVGLSLTLKNFKKWTTYFVPVHTIVL